MVKKTGVLVLSVMLVLLSVSVVAVGEEYCNTFFDSPEKLSVDGNLCAKRLVEVTSKTIPDSTLDLLCYGVYKGIPLTSVNDFVNEKFENPYVQKQSYCETTEGTWVQGSSWEQPGDKATLLKCIDDSQGTGFGSLYKMDCLVDADNDGVADENDACPGTKPGLNVDPTGCKIWADCSSTACAQDETCKEMDEPTIKKCVSNHCSNTVQDEDEVSVDCGGNDCLACNEAGGQAKKCDSTQPDDSCNPNAICVKSGNLKNTCQTKLDGILLCDGILFTCSTGNCNPNTQKCDLNYCDSTTPCSDPLKKCATAGPNKNTCVDNFCRDDGDQTTNVACTGQTETCVDYQCVAGACTENADCTSPGKNTCTNGECVQGTCETSGSCFLTGEICINKVCVAPNADGDFDGDGKVDKADKDSIKSKVKEFVAFIKSLNGQDSLGKEIHKYLRKIK